MLILTEQEIQALTGRQRRPAQLRALKWMGIEHRVRPDVGTFRDSLPANFEGEFVVGRALDRVLDEAKHPDVEEAIEELNQMRALQGHLVAHYVAVRRQNDALHSALEDFSLLGKL